MTPRQLELARHALGLRPGRLVSTRNLWWCVPPDPDLGEWEAMVAAGHAVRRPLDRPFENVAAFHLTRAGAERALLPGDVLDAEDWPMNSNKEHDR